ncbi:CDP-alcohol phosphatidyltransferase family protein [Actinomadura graeca]|uniref:CDP-alcohol phosphatidyltransferase family protein n=1 Tax=Actinomadura graeca TaxID=2750812 RepID=A0ABX8QVP3_9ACTN|nr:hypothetical protein [Actinomadura graeca]QXJ22059.1 CDP-alcohol phosphatidyltransferase family protein [Actinomadura graeca]
MTRVLIIATGCAADTTPTAALPCGGGPEAPTLLTRLCRRLDTLNVPGRGGSSPDKGPGCSVGRGEPSLHRRPERHVVTRPGLAPALRKDGHDVIECEDVAGDLREIARLARAAHGPVAVLPGDLVVGGGPLRRLMRDAAPAAALTVPARPDGYGLAPVRLDGGRIVAAGTPSQRPGGADAASPGALRVDGPRAAVLADLADGLAALLETPGTLDAESPRPAEAGELLLAALVRAGVPVASCDAGRSVCARAGNEQESRAVTEEADGRPGRPGVFVGRAGAAAGRDGGVVACAADACTPHLTRWTAWWRLTPNTVTGLSAGVAALAAVWFSDGTRPGMIAGAFLLCLSFVLGRADGRLVRHARRPAFGAWLDAMSLPVKESAVYAGLAIGAGVAAPGGAVHAGNVWPLAVAALALTVRPGGADAGTGPGRACLRRAREAAALPEGERCALVAVTAAAADARVAFIALIAWGAAAAVLVPAGQLLRVAAR